MNATSRPRWDQCRFVALGVLLSGLALPVTGIADHLARHASGPDAAGWVAFHIALGTLFVVFATWHAVLNRRALLRYLRGREATAGASRRRSSCWTVRAARPAGTASPSALSRSSARSRSGTTGTPSSTLATGARDAAGPSRPAKPEPCQTGTAVASFEVQRSLSPLPATAGTPRRTSSSSAIPEADDSQGNDMMTW